MNEPKKHHYVPESYQELFRDPETKELYRLDLSTGKSTRHNPKNKLYKIHLYTLDTPPEGTKRTEIENPLLSKLDERYKIAISNTLKETSTLDKSTLSVCIAFLKNRNPDMIDELGYLASKFHIYKIYDFIKHDKSRHQKAIQLGFDMASADSFNSSLRGMKVSAERDYNLLAFLGVSSLQSAVISRMKWTLIKSTSKPFILSDRPVTQTICYDESNSETHALIVPISSSLCIEIQLNEGELEHIEADEDEVSEINKAIAYCAKKIIIGPNQEQLHQVYSDLNS